MSNINTGGAALPTAGQIVEFGMSLRDYFAGQAIGAVIRQCSDDLNFSRQAPEQYFAQHAYAIADAMLAERERTEDAP